MMPLTGRRISRKGIAAVAGTLLIGLFGVETDLHRRARAAIRVHQSDVAELRDAAREEWRRRPPVLDPGASQGVPVDLREAILSSDSQVPPEGSEDPLRESRWINRVTQALRSNPLEVRFNPRHPDRESESDARQKVLFRKGCVDFASTLSRVASAHAAGGRDADAVRSIEVILVLARDLSLDPLQEPMLSLWCQETGLRALGDLLTGTGLAAEELKRLAASLEGLRGSTRSFARQWALQFAAYRAQVHSGLSVGLFEFFPSVNEIGV